MIDNQKMMEITGGGFKVSLAIVLGSLITFIGGIIDGYLRPLKCNS